MSCVHHQFTVRYASVPHEAIADKNISHGAFRVLLYIFSRPDGWKIYNNDIKKVIGIGKSHTLSKYWQELLSAGWISRKKIRNTTGKITGGYNYILYDKPIVPIMDNMGSNESTIMPIIGNAENSTNGQMGTHSNTDLINNTDLKESGKKKQNKSSPKLGLDQRKSNFEKNALDKCAPSESEKVDFSKFILYFTEHGDNDEIMRCESIKPFNTAYRWKEWKDRTKRYAKEKSNVTQFPKKQDIDSLIDNPEKEHFSQTPDWMGETLEGEQ
jgi:hypothetical protein